MQIRAFEEKKPLWSLLGGLFFFLALMAKENAITFLAVIPLTYYFFTKADLGQPIKQLSPMLLAAVLFLVIRTSILGFSLGKVSIE